MSELWKELHTMTSRDQLEEWEKKIPKFNKCKCKNHYTQFKRLNPPPETDFFKWTVDLHNAVNVRLKKKIVPLTEAKLIWNI